MIDDYAKVKDLIRKMEAHLPIPARPTRGFARLIQARRFKIPRNRDLSIQRVFYLGDEGGIACDVTPSQDAKEAYVVSLTHLQVLRHHPLAEEIRAYQQQRITRLAQENQQGRQNIRIWP